MIHNVIFPRNLLRGFGRRWHSLWGGRFFIVFILFGLMLLHPHTGLAQKMYWTNQNGPGRIQRANLNGAGVEDLVTGLSIPIGIALDVAAGKMYWTDTGPNKIQRANLDGTGVEDLVTAGLDDPLGIALDLAAGKMYWTDALTQKIQRANLDGSSVEDLVTGLGLPFGIALDVAAGKMYWTDFDTDKIQRANLDGTSVEDLVTTGLDVPEGIALDVAAGKMYWVDFTLGRIQRANLDGSSVEDLVTGLTNASAIALDVAAGKMYWSEAGFNSIRRTNLDGTGLETLVIGPIVRVGLALDLSAAAKPLALLADKELEITAMGNSEGDIHSNKSVEIKKGKSKTLLGNISAVEEVEIDKKNTIDGDVEAGQKVTNKGTVLGTIYPFATVDEIPLPSIDPFTPGSQNISVPKNGSQALSPGDYKNVNVGEKATLTLSSGVYNLMQLEMDKKSRLEILITSGVPVVINLVEEIEFGKEVKMIISGGSSQDVTINSTYTKTMHFLDRSTLQGSLIAPYAKVSLGKKVGFKGAICAEEIEVLAEAIFLHHSSSTPLPKIEPIPDEEDPLAGVPTDYQLSQNYPNPFNPTTTIRFALPEAGTVSLKIYNLRGQLVKTLASGHYQAGYHQVQWDAANEFGDKVASGFYFYSIQAGSFHQVKKMLLIK